MTEFTPNRIVLLPCRMIRELENGTYQVSIETGDEPIEGRVNPDTLLSYGDERVYAQAVVMHVKRRIVIVWIPGAFEKSDGQIRLDRDWAETHTKEENAPGDGTSAGPDGERKLPPYWGHGWFHEA